jgi:uncharacterized membrane protein
MECLANARHFRYSVLDEVIMAFCATCGAEVSGRFCQKCGAPVAGPAPGPTPGPTPGANPTPNDPGVQPLPVPISPNVGMTDNLAGALCYLFGFITGILFLVLAPYNQNRTIRFHAFQSIFLNIAWIILFVIVEIFTLAFRFIPILGIFISAVLHLSIGLGGLIVWLYMMFKTYNGEKVVLPIVGPMADKQAGV